MVPMVFSANNMHGRSAPMSNPTTAAEWAEKCWKKCHIRAGRGVMCCRCADAYARQQVEACYQVLVNAASCDHAGLKPADPAAFQATLDQIIYSKVEAFRERAATLALSWEAVSDIVGTRLIWRTVTAREIAAAIRALEP